MSPYTKRPSGEARRKEDYWVRLIRPDETVQGHEVLSSPGFPNRSEAMGWMHHYRRDSDEVTLYRREFVGGGFKDHAEHARDDDAYPDPARLAALLRETRDGLDLAKADRRKPPLLVDPESDELSPDEKMATRQAHALRTEERLQARARELIGRAVIDAGPTADATMPTLTYSDVYDQEGRVNAELEAEAEAMLARLQARGLA